MVNCTNFLNLHFTLKTHPWYNSLIISIQIRSGLNVTNLIVIPLSLIILYHFVIKTNYFTITKDKFSQFLASSPYSSLLISTATKIINSPIWWICFWLAPFGLTRPVKNQLLRAHVQNIPESVLSLIFLFTSASTDIYFLLLLISSLSIQKSHIHFAYRRCICVNTNIQIIRV